jgi:hypothetical protein
MQTVAKEEQGTGHTDRAPAIRSIFQVLEHLTRIYRGRHVARPHRTRNTEIPIK